MHPRHCGAQQGILQRGELTLLVRCRCHRCNSSPTVHHSSRCTSCVLLQTCFCPFEWSGVAYAAEMIQLRCRYRARLSRDSRNNCSGSSRHMLYMRHFSRWAARCHTAYFPSLHRQEVAFSCRHAQLLKGGRNKRELYTTCTAALPLSVQHEPMCAVPIEQHTTLDKHPQQQTQSKERRQARYLASQEAQQFCKQCMYTRYMCVAVSPFREFAGVHHAQDNLY
jgi:hypothetical protein